MAPMMYLRDTSVMEGPGMGRQGEARQLPSQLASQLEGPNVHFFILKNVLLFIIDSIMTF